ncbi:hypothetical protein ACLB1S_32035 [Escherichia coli]
MKHILLFIFTVLLSLPSYGSVVIMGTRVIYPAEQKSIYVRLNNGGVAPYRHGLIQASSPPDSVFGAVYYYASCFPGGAAFRTDDPVTFREKIFRQTGNHLSLNVLMCGQPYLRENIEKAQGYNYLQFAVRSRISFSVLMVCLFSPDDAYIRK